MKAIIGPVLLAILGGSVEGIVGWGFQNFFANDKLRTEAEKLSAQIAPEIASRPDPDEKPKPISPKAPEWTDKEVGDFGILVLSQEYRWKLGTTQVLAPGGEDVDIEEKLKGLLFQYGRKYGDLIAVGTASCEGERDEESQRAAARSKVLIAALRPNVDETEPDNPRQLYRLEMGQFKDCQGLNSGQTGEQRQVILLAVKARNHGMELAELQRTLCATLKERTPLGFDPDEYSECSLKPARPKP